MTRRAWEIYWPIRTEDQWPGDWVATMDNYDGPGALIGSGATRRAAIESLLERVMDRQYAGCDHTCCEPDKCQAEVDFMLDLTELVDRADREGK